jgi:hypothetical protein
VPSRRCARAHQFFPGLAVLILGALIAWLPPEEPKGPGSS